MNKFWIAAASTILATFAAPMAQAQAAQPVDRPYKEAGRDAISNI